MKKIIATAMFCGVLSGCAGMTNEQLQALGNFGRAMQDYNYQQQQYYQQQQQRNTPISCSSHTFSNGYTSTTCY